MRRRGMTLLELMVVVSIIGALSAMAGLSFSRLRSIGRSREGTRMILSYLRDARLRAVTSGIRHGVYISTIPDALIGGPLTRADGNMMLYRKPRADFPGAFPFYEPGAALDVQLSQSSILDRGQSLGRGGAAPPPWVEAGQAAVLVLTFDAGGGGYVTLANGSAIDISFDAEGRPNVTLRVNGGVDDLTDDINAFVERRFVIRLRDDRDDAAGGLLGMPNPSARCAEVLVTGTTRSLSRDGTRPECL